MKKILCTIVLATSALALGAQEWQDAYLFSENNYVGTARSAAMGNAMTALGGDPGSLSFNPAGSSVSAYSQVYFGAGVSISTAYATGTIAEGDTQAIGFGYDTKSTYSRPKLPNMGAVISVDTGRRSGLKRHSFGFVYNTTNDYTHRLKASGINSNNSFAGSLAAGADGFLTDVMANEDWMFYGDASRMPRWIDMTGYRSGIISGVTGADGAYIGLTEVMDENGDFRLAAPVYQEYGRQTRGWKGDLIMNWSANFSDKFFVGANLTVVTNNYTLNEYWYEAPDNAEDFAPISFSDGTTARFQSLRMKRYYAMEGSGINLKVGAIWLPFNGLRLGAAIQTPTATNITERYSYTGESSLSGMYRSPVSSEEDVWTYALTEPFRYNLGAALAVGKLALLSADYEYANYGQCRFGSSTGDDFGGGSSDFDYVNQDIADILGASHIVRVGLEMKPVPGIAVRTGYNYQTSPVKDGSEAGKTVVSFGLGYSSSGSFYADFALRFRFLPREYIIPYTYSYAPDPQKYWNKVVDDGIMTPEIAIDSTVADAFVTVGWRF